MQESGEEACLIKNNFSQPKKPKKKEKKKEEICLEEEEDEEEEGNGLRSVGFLHCIRGRHERERERERERSARETRESAHLQTSVSSGETERRSRS